MKRKSPARTEPTVAPEILEGAQRSLAGDRAVGDARLAVPVKRAPRCTVCNAEASAATPDQQTNTAR